MQMNLNRLGLATVLVCSSLQAQAVGRLADVTVIDRNSGVTLPVYTNKGEYWVAGAPGARYAIAIRNKLGERVMAVTSVDGINVVSGATAAWGQTGYVFDAHYNYQITGWRKSSSEVAAFEFAPASDSYAERTGRPNQVGVIGVAVFRERLPELRGTANTLSFLPAGAGFERQRIARGHCGCITTAGSSSRINHNKSVRRPHRHAFTQARHRPRPT